MSFRYSPLKRASKKFYRKFFPVSESPWQIGEVEDICAITLVPPEDLKVFFKSCIKKLQAIKGDNIGDYLEFGVFNGSSLSSMYLAAQEINLSSTRFFGFDSFEGLPEGSGDEDDGTWKKGYYACSFEKMKDCLERKNIDSKDITWVKGWYSDTLNQKTIKKYSLKKIGMVFIDCDTYSSSKAVLNFLGPLLKEEVILCFDDWKLYDLDVKGEGEYRAFNEFLEENSHLKAKEIKSYNRKSRSFIVGLR